MKHTIEILFSLIKYAVFETAIDEETRDAVFNCADKLYKFSKHHDVAHLVSFAVEKNKIPLPQTDNAKKFRKRHPIAVIRYEAANAVYRQVCEVFEKEEIPFIPLKGSVIRELYPEPWMRTSCDIDILVHETDIERASEILVNTCGCEKDKAGTHDVSFCSANGTHIELHYKLSEIYFDNAADALVDDVWNYSYPKDGYRYHYVLTDEFFYMYHIYHMAKHFEIGGCGIRPFLDLWLLDNKVAHENDKRDSLLVKSGLLKFANSCRELSEYWFSDGVNNETVNALQRFIIVGGVYGNSNNRHLVVRAKNDNRIKRVFKTVFLSYDKLKIQYPIVGKHKWLMPFFEVLRWFRIFKPGYGKIAKEELIVSSKPKDESTESFTLFLKQIGLKQ